MNVAPMIFRFCSGSVTPASRSRNSRDGVDEHERQLAVVSKRLPNLLGFVLPQHAVVDEDAREPVADGAVDEQRRDGRIDAAAQAADDPSVADLRARIRSVASSTNDAIVQSPGAAADVVGEIAQDLEPAIRVRHLGVEQQRVEPPRSAMPSPPPARWRSWPSP